MKIRYEGQIEHMIAFNRFHHANSPTTRRQRFLMVWVVPALPLLLTLFSMWRDLSANVPDPMIFLPDWIFDWIIALIFALVSSLFFRWLFPRILERNVRKLLAEGRNETLLGWREMELVNNRLIVETKWIYSRVDLQAIEKIVTDGGYTFVYIASIQAFIIPMNLYPEEEYREFVAELREAWNRREELADEASAGKTVADVRIVEPRY